MELFVPRKVLMEEAALQYPLGMELEARFAREQIEVEIIASHNRIKPSKLKTDQQKYQEAKETLVIGVRKGLEFQSCKPSAHYQLPLATSCPGMCEYCYLQTTLGKRPFVRIYVNQEEILNQAKNYMEKRKPEITIFEGAATSDPLAVEPYSRGLAKAIEFFSQEELGLFRFVTKFTTVESLLKLKHNGRTRFRYSLNTNTIIKGFEHHTPSLRQRLDALTKVQQSGYPVGIVVAPIIMYPGWEEEYTGLIHSIKQSLPLGASNVTFELISHRYTTKAKNNIQALFPNTKLPMAEADRQVKYGQFGYMKYVYQKEAMDLMKQLLTKEIKENLPESKIEYFI
ncbi:MAG: spore photoproduct lyase [Bacillota bacterium]|nr:spore photoproduct lyase [Bacillota bacterium]